MSLRELLRPALLFVCVLMSAGLDAAVAPQENWNVVLTPVATEFHDHTGLDHHQPGRKLLVTANTNAASANSFELVAADGTHAAFSNVAGLQGDVLVATARDDGQGMSRGGFQPGTIFASTSVPAAIARISADGSAVQNPWVSLAGEGAITGSQLDRTGVFGGDLIVVTATGGVWRVNASATPTRLAALDTALGGVAVVPNDPLAYGPWAGKVLTGASDRLYAIDAQGQSVSFAAGLRVRDIDIVPPHENFFAIDSASRKILGAPDDAFTGIIGDILITQESPGRVARVRWDGTTFVVSALAEAVSLRQVAFSPAGAGAIQAVKQVYDSIAVVRHAPLLDSGRVEGTLWQLTGEEVLLDGTDTITSDLLVPGTPLITTAASASYGGTIEGSESSAPSGYRITIQGNATLRHVVTRTDAMQLQAVVFPPAATGTRDVQLRKADDTIGDAATLRHLDLAGNAGAVAVPPGTYGRFTISGRNTLVLGIEGATEAAIYNLEELSLTGGSSLRVAGPVVLRVRNAVSLAGSTAGAADAPSRLRLEVAHGRPSASLSITGTSVLYAIVRTPGGKVTISGNARLRGTVACDVLAVDGNGVLQITENDLPPPAVNRPPAANAGADQTITLPIDTISLDGTASDDGLPAGSTLAVTWTKVSGPGAVAFSAIGTAATTATFAVDGDYVLQLTASDGQLSSSDTVSITVIPRNQPPVVDAGEAQTIELPAQAALHATVTDDALPRGMPLTVTWSLLAGPAEVTFADVHAAATTASFSAPGVYTLRLSANDTEFTVTGDVVVTVLQNVAPVVEAGDDATITLPNDTLALDGTVTDDGLPSNGTLTIHWTKISGPGAVTFADATSAATSATFAIDGTYVLALTASDGALTTSDTVTIVVIPLNLAPVADAGPAQTIELPALASLQGNATDDGLPRDSVLSVTWSRIDGPGPVTFANAHAAITTASFTAPGVYTLRLTVDDTELTATDDVVITVLQNKAPVVNAGADIELTLPTLAQLRGTATDDAYPAGSTLEVFWTQVSGPPVIFHDAFALATPVAIPTAGTYVLRLTASDSQLSATDDITIVAHPRPNQPPKITSAAPKEYLLGAVPTGDGETVNLSPWTVKQYPSSQGNASWQRDATNTIVTQTINADPSILVSDFNLSNAQMEGTWRVNTRDDDDYIGFVFGYQNSEHFYLFDWKQTSQDSAARGMSLKVVSADTPLTGDDFWPTAGNARVKPLYHNTIGWAEFTDYQFTLQFYPGEIRIVVKQGATVLADFTVNDSTYTNGRFGFYNYSQAAVRYSGFRRLSLARGTYTYDVEATDIDGDPLTYSLAAAPLGMTIDAATGLITWPVTSAVAGNHPVSVRVQTPDGRSDTQSYTLTILSPNQAPVVNAGDDRLITTGTAATLNATATDDGFPHNSTLALTWSKVSGPGTVTFANPAVAATTATFTQSGNYLLRLSATDGELPASDEVTVTANTTPVVNAGADQTLSRSNTLALNGVVTDDGVPSADALSVVWDQVGGPTGVTFDTPGSRTTRAIFPGAGTYTLRLTGNDTLHSATDNVTVVVNASPELDGATLAIVAVNGGPYATGTAQPLRATLRSSTGTALANYGVQFDVTGANATTGSAVTDANGVAAFSYTGANVGTDSIRAFVRNTTTTIQSATISISWTQSVASPPATQGWIGSPLHGTAATGILPITAGAGVTVAQGTIEYWPSANPTAVTVLASGTQGGPGSTLAALDTTLLANGNYIIRLTATDANGQLLVSQVLITVAGENKPGRMTLAFTDLTVPAAGMPITITRRYDSLERNVAGDFGHGWSLEMAGPRLDVSLNYDVTITEPGTGRRVTFQFAPAAFGFPFSFLYQPAYAAEAGVYGKLTANGCATLVRTTSGVACYGSPDPYRPTVYTYSDPLGRVYTMTAAGTMQSIKDLNGVVLTFSAAGITSSAGNLNVPFARDAQGRITQITDLEGRAYRYDYDAAGDLVAVHLPGITTPYRYTYQPGHSYSSSTDPRGNAQASSTYHADGRVASFTDAAGHTTRYDYDVAANRTITTNPDGGVVTSTYAANGLLLSETNALGHTTSSTYDGNRNRLTETNAIGQTTTHTYDARGNRTSTTDATGKTIRWTYNQYGMPATITDPLGRVQTTKFDSSANPISIEDSLGVRVTLTINAHGNPLTETDGNGKTTRFTYDTFGRLLTRTDPLGRTISYTYDDMGRVVTMTDTRGGVTRSTYDPLGNLLTVTDPLNGVTRYEYDGNSNKTAMVDAAGRRTTYTYDAANRLTKITNPDDTTQSFTYDFRGKRLTETDEDGHTTTYEYDKAGRQVKVTHADGSEVSFTYDAVDRVIAKTDERGLVTRFEYDPSCGCSERLSKTTDPQGGVTAWGFDAAGRLISQTDANQHTTRFDYDARNLLTQVTYADGMKLTRTYDGAGHKLTETDQAGRTTRFTYDEAGNVSSVTDALNQLTVHTYDAADKLLSTTDALGRTTRFEYDAMNRLVKRTLPLGMSEEFTYDQVGNRVTRTDFRGKQTRYEYDAMNRLVTKTPDATLAEPSVRVTYDRDGLRASMSDASGTTAYTYDARHRPLTKQTPQGTLTYTYDAAGHVMSARSSNPNGFSVTYGYDDLDRLESVTDPRTNATTTYTHDAVGSLLSATLPNGVQMTNTYDTVDRPTQLTHTRGTTIAKYTQTLDATGRRQSVAELNGRSAGYTHDALYRLTGETIAGDAAANGSISYTYDAVANRLSRTSTLSAVPSATLAYDANDRLTSEAYDANGNTRSANGITYTYDFEDRIRSANNGAVRIVYDGDGNRVAKTVGGVTTRYLVDDLSPTGYSQVVEELAGGNVQRVYTWGERAISQRQLRNGNWQSSFFGLDAYGSVRFLTDGNGSVTDTYAYDAFGILTTSTGTTPNDLLFNAQQYDRDLGVYFKRARYYSDDRGRFLTMDPVAGFASEPLTLHRYNFGNADPANRIDPWGTMAAEYSATARLAAARSAALRCLANMGVGLLTETATEFLVIYAVQQVTSGANYVGRTGERTTRPPGTPVDEWTEVRFREHRRTSRFAGGLEPVSEFNVRIPKNMAAGEKRKLIQTIEQMAINAFKGKLELVNSIDAMNAQDYKKYRRYFCKK